MIILYYHWHSQHIHSILIRASNKPAALSQVVYLKILETKISAEFSKYLLVKIKGD